jgi:hypothetical protein
VLRGSHGYQCGSRNWSVGGAAGGEQPPPPRSVGGRQGHRGQTARGGRATDDPEVDSWTVMGSDGSRAPKTV